MWCKIWAHKKLWELWEHMWLKEAAFSLWEWLECSGHSVIRGKLVLWKENGMTQGLQNQPTECTCPVKWLVVKWMDNVSEASERPSSDKWTLFYKGKDLESRLPQLLFQIKMSNRTYFLLVLHSQRQLLQGLEWNYQQPSFTPQKGWVNDRQTQPHITLQSRFRGQVTFWHVVFLKSLIPFFTNMHPLNMIRYTHFLSIIFLTP